MDLVKTLALHGESVDATWADFSALIKFATAKSRDGFVRENCGTTREKQQMRAELINRSVLGIRVILWGEAERLAREIFVLITNIVGPEYVFYVGTTVYEQNTTGYCNEALACVLDTKRNPVVFPKDSDRCTVDQVIHDLQFQAMHLTQRSQYMEVRMLETCIHTLMHDMPGLLWFHRGAGPYLSKLEDVQRQIKRGTISSLFLAFAPKEHLSGHKVRVRDNMPELQAFLNC